MDWKTFIKNMLWVALGIIVFLFFLAFWFFAPGDFGFLFFIFLIPLFFINVMRKKGN